ncbi:hypothetical protein MRX96_055888 [Rhipicephalus microplus]
MRAGTTPGWLWYLESCVVGRAVLPGPAHRTGKAVEDCLGRICSGWSSQVQHDTHPYTHPPGAQAVLPGPLPCSRAGAPLSPHQAQDPQHPSRARRFTFQSTTTPRRCIIHKHYLPHHGHDHGHYGHGHKHYHHDNGYYGHGHDDYGGYGGHKVSYGIHKHGDYRWHRRR